MYEEGRSSDLRRVRLSGHHDCGCKCEWDFFSSVLHIRREELQVLLHCRETRWHHKNSCWTTGDDFVWYMEYFIKYTVVRKDKRLLTVVDSDRPHLDMSVLDLAKYGGGVMSRPPHTSVTGHPLEISACGTFRFCEYWVWGMNLKHSWEN